MGNSNIRDFHHCGHGWSCLSPQEQFGVIFSIAIVVLSLVLCWMYLLGRRITSHRMESTRPLPGGRRAPRNPNLPSDLSLGQLPIAQQLPGQPPQTYYQPVVYNLGPNQPLQAWPYIIAGPGQQIGHRINPTPTYVSRMPLMSAAPGATIYLPTTNISQSYAQEPRQGHGNDQSRLEREQPPHPGNDYHMDQQPLSWRQRLARTFNLPTGRASTIASSDASSRSPSRSLHKEPLDGPQSHQAAANNSDHTNIPVAPANVAEPPTTHAHHKNEKAATTDSDGQSQDTNVATVHSDDYDMPLRQSSEVTPPIMHHQHITSPDQGHSSMVSSETTGSTTSTNPKERAAVPSVSSISHARLVQDMAVTRRARRATMKRLKAATCAPESARTK